MKRYNAKTFKPLGVFVGMPMDAYRNAPGLNSSSLKLLLESPLTFKRKRDGLLPDAKTQAMTAGTILHSCILEGRLNYATVPATYGPEDKPWNRNAKECREWHEANPLACTEAESQFVRDSFGYVLSHPKCRDLLNGGKAEVSVFAPINGRICKGRFDYYLPGHIVDLKTVADASSDGLSRAVIRYGWHVQAAFYVKLAEVAFGTKPLFTWVALQKGGMPLVNVKRFGMFASCLGEEAMAKAMTALDKCESEQRWPEWADDDTNEIKPLVVPEWAMHSDETLDMEN